MEFPTFINWTNSFRIQGCWAVSFNFIQILKEYFVSNSAEPDQTSRSGSALFAYIPRKGR